MGPRLWCGLWRMRTFLPALAMISLKVRVVAAAAGAAAAAAWALPKTTKVENMMVAMRSCGVAMPNTSGGARFAATSSAFFVHVALASGSSASTASGPTERRDAAGLVAARRGPWVVVVSANATQGSRSSEIVRIGAVGRDCRTPIAINAARSGGEIASSATLGMRMRRNRGKICVTTP